MIRTSRANEQRSVRIRYDVNENGRRSSGRPMKT